MDFGKIIKSQKVRLNVPTVVNIYENINIILNNNI